MSSLFMLVSIDVSLFCFESCKNHMHWMHQDLLSIFTMLAEKPVEHQQCCVAKWDFIFFACVNVHGI